jgi:hypothetical protein
MHAMQCICAPIGSYWRPSLPIHFYIDIIIAVLCVCMVAMSLSESSAGRE